MFIKEVVPSFVKNSRGERGVQIEVVTYEGRFKCSAPSGKSTGKAEVFSYSDLIEHGSENALYELGLAKTEGKEYIVKDGDCIFFKFNV